MKNKIRHVLGISGGKDSAALAIYLNDKYPDLDLEYYFCDTGKELDETYKLIDDLEVYLGKRITRLEAASKSYEDPFDHFLKLFGGFLPSSTARWCTKRLKLDPFEEFIGNDPTVSYVGIRGDEDREGYISKKTNIQSIFPFRRNIWSEEVIAKILANNSIKTLCDLYEEQVKDKKLKSFLDIVNEPISPSNPRKTKLHNLLNLGVRTFNRVVFSFLKSASYPLSKISNYELIENEDNLVRDDIFKLLRDSGVGVPNYYEKVEFELDGAKGEYARSRSGCFFCFFQQKIEWVWLYEKHPKLFKKAMSYEKEGYSWMSNETLEELIAPERIKQIKIRHLKKSNNETSKKSPYLVDILEEAEGEGCASCFL